MVATNLVMITIGTGVGGGLVLGGRIYRGATGGAGELGHTLGGRRSERAVASGRGFSSARVARACRRGIRARPRCRTGGSQRASLRLGPAPRERPVGARSRHRPGGSRRRPGRDRRARDLGRARRHRRRQRDQHLRPGRGGAWRRRRTSGGATARARATGGALLRGPGSRSQHEDPSRGTGPERVCSAPACWRSTSCSHRSPWRARPPSERRLRIRRCGNPCRIMLVPPARLTRTRRVGIPAAPTAPRRHLAKGGASRRSRAWPRPRESGR
jgi:hypothetical protein